MAATTKTVKVIRPFYYNRELHKAGRVVELPAYFANEVIYSNKAELADEAPQAPAPAPARVAEKKAEK